MDTWQDHFLRDVEERRLPKLRAQLAPMEVGKMYLGERKDGGPWVDTTQREIDRLKQEIRVLETLAAQIRSGEVPTKL